MTHDRRAGDHPWEIRARVIVGSLLGCALAWLLVTGGLHAFSDVAIGILMFAIGSMLKVNMSQLLDWLPLPRRSREEER
jgi:hypothetical protein